MPINQACIETFPRHSLLRLVQHTLTEELYEAALRELYRRDSERLRRDWTQIMTGDR